MHKKPKQYYCLTYMAKKQKYKDAQVIAPSYSTSNDRQVHNMVPMGNNDMTTLNTGTNKHRVPMCTVENIACDCLAEKRETN